MAEQNGPVEVITLEEFWARIATGTAVTAGTLVLMPVERLQAAQAHLGELERALAQLEVLAAQRQQIIDHADTLFQPRSNA